MTLADYVTAVVSGWPALSVEQKDRLVTILRRGQVVVR